MFWEDSNVNRKGLIWDLTTTKYTGIHGKKIYICLVLKYLNHAPKSARNYYYTVVVGSQISPFLFTFESSQTIFKRNFFMYFRNKLMIYFLDV